MKNEKMFSTDAETSGYRIKVLQLMRTFLLPVGGRGRGTERLRHTAHSTTLLKLLPLNTVAMTVKSLLICG